MRRIKRDIVGAVIVSKDGKILLGKSAPKAVGVYSGSWVIPGGGVDEGESREEALIREVLEETHHDISACELEPVENKSKGESKKKLKDTGEMVLVEMTFNDYLVRLDKTADERGERPSEELVEIKWFDREGINNADLSPPTSALLEKLDLKD